MRIIFFTYLELGPAVIKGFTELDVDGSSPVGEQAARILALTLLANNICGSDALEAAEMLAEGIQVYSQASGKFLDKSKSFREHSITGDSLLILSAIRDASRLADLVQLRKMSIIDSLAMEILNGK